MTEAVANGHLSIGEVLALVQADFPDVTISKIRFLESQGLLDPERTPSGYRKFYDSDIERLRWILRQQRENFLPLKVIKDRLAAGDLDDDVAADPVEPAAGADPAPSVPAEPAAAPSRPRRAVAAEPSRSEIASLLQEAPAPRTTAPRETATPAAPAALFDTGATAVSLSLEELISATGLTAREVGDLERFGMLASRSLGSTTYYDEDALLVARLAAAFRSHGVEARHLRMYKVAAEREAGVFEQLLVPMSRKRSPQGRREATELVNELAGLGDGLRAAMLRMLLRDYLDGS